MQKFGLVVEVNDESLILRTKHLVEEGVAGAALFAEHAALAQACIDQQSERQREIRFAAEVLDDFRAPVFLQRKVVFRQVVNDLAVLVAHGSEHVDHFHVDGNSGLLPVDTMPADQQYRKHTEDESRQEATSNRNAAGRLAHENSWMCL